MESRLQPAWLSHRAARWRFSIIVFTRALPPEGGIPCSWIVAAQPVSDRFIAQSWQCLGQSGTERRAPALLDDTSRIRV